MCSDGSSEQKRPDHMFSGLVVPKHCSVQEFTNFLEEFLYWGKQKRVLTRTALTLPYQRFPAMTQKRLAISQFVSGQCLGRHSKKKREPSSIVLRTFRTTSFAMCAGGRI